MRNFWCLFLLYSLFILFCIHQMLATTWYVFGVGTANEYPDDFQHYFVYWVGPCMAAIAASIVYVIYGTLLLVLAGRGDIYLYDCMHAMPSL
jgi:hypothetical protein